MKAFLLLICNIMIFCVAVGQTTEDEKQIKAIFQRIENAWNKDDFSFFKDETYTPDAVLITPIGEYWKGQAEIVKGVALISEGMLKNMNSKYTVKDIKFLAPNVALVVTHVADQVEQDFNYPDGSKGPAKGETSATIMMHNLVKENGVWNIAATQITNIVTPGAGPMSPVSSQR